MSGNDQHGGADDAASDDESGIDVEFDNPVKVSLHRPPEGVSRREFMAGAGAGAAAMLAGCGGQTDNADQTTQSGNGQTTNNQETTETNSDDQDGLNHVHFICDYTNERWQQRWQKLIPEFEKEHGVPMNIEYSGVIGSGGQQRLFNLVQAGDPPEMYLGDPGHYMDLVVNGTAMKLNDLIEEIGQEVGPFNEKAIARTNIRGDYYQTVSGLYNAIFNYRSDLYDQLSLDVPQTQQELLDAAQAIDEDGSIPARGYALCGTVGGKSNADFLNFLMCRDSWVVEWEDQDNKTLPDGLQPGFREEGVVELLEYFQQLAEYSPDPSSLSWGNTVEHYANNRVAQQYHLNTWPLTAAIAIGADDIVANTGVDWIPKKAGTNPTVRGFPGPDGSPIFKGENSNTEGARKFQKWWLGDLKRNAENYHAFPTRFVPPSEKIATSEHYTEGQVFKDYPNTLRINQKIIGELASKMAGPQSKHPYTPVVGYLRRFDIFSTTMNRALVGEENLSKVHNEMRERLVSRFDEAMEKFSAL